MHISHKASIELLYKCLSVYVMLIRITCVYHPCGYLFTIIIIIIMVQKAMVRTYDFVTTTARQTYSHEYKHTNKCPHSHTHSEIHSE